MFRERESSERMQLSRWSNLGLIAATALICLSILELGSYFYFHQIKSYTSVESIRRYEYDPYRGYRLAPSYNRDGAQHNSQGFRRTGDIERQKPTGTYRIFLVGGSTAYGASSSGSVFPTYLVSNHETIDSYLERVLNESNLIRRVEVINAAAPGYWTHHHLISLNQDLLDYSPDMIIFLDGHNDHYVLNPHHRQFGPTRTSEYIDELNRPTLLGVMEHVIQYGSTRSWFGFGLENSLNKIQSWSANAVDGERLSGNLEDYERIAQRSFLKMIKRNVLILRDEGIVPVILLQPELALPQKKRFTAEEKELLRIELAYRQEGYEQKLDMVNQKAGELIRQLAEQYEFCFMDLRDVFADVDAQAYIDYAHLTPAGSRHVAEFVGKRIIPLIVAAEAGRSSCVDGNRPVAVLPSDTALTTGRLP